MLNIATFKSLNKMCKKKEKRAKYLETVINKANIEKVIFYKYANNLFIEFYISIDDKN